MRRDLVIVALCVAAGLYARVIGLGAAPLAVDEYYFAESVDHVLERGLPRFDDGGYYVQALLPQYAAALAVLVLGPTETAYRLPALLAGLLLPVLAYRYARGHMDHAMALAVAAALMVSSWEIELSRFARMYTPLACATLAFLTWLDRSLTAGARWRRYEGHFWIAAATLCHLLAVLLAPLLLAPLLDWRGNDRFATARDRWRYAAVTAMAVVALALFATFDFRRWGAGAVFPEGYVRATAGFLRLPVFPLFGAGFDSRWGVMLIVAAMGAALAAPGRVTWAMVAAVAAAMHQFTVVALAVCAELNALSLWSRLGFNTRSLWSRLCLSRPGLNSSFLEELRDCGKGQVSVRRSFSHALWSRLGFDSRWAGSARDEVFHQPAAGGAVAQFRRLARRDRIALGLAALFPAAWIAAALVSRGEFVRLTGASGFPGAVRRAFFGWPDFLHPLWEPWSHDLPVVAVLTLGAVAVLLTTMRAESPLRGPAAAIAYALLAMGTVKYYFMETRYLFHFYPVALTAIAILASRIAKQHSVILFGVAFALSGDFDPRHIARAGTPEVDFRMGAFESRGSLWYPRADYRAVASWLNGALSGRPPQPLIAGYCAPLERYFRPDHAIYVARESSTFQEKSRDRGRRELWSGRRLLSTPEEAIDYTRAADTVWLVRCLPQDDAGLAPRRIWGARIAESRREFVSLDGKVEILRLRLESTGTAAP